ncbi:lipocalin family protein [Methylomagnum ishizawai]|nr:lipocalin family protein [Methylomagnum ishizawai]
MGAYHMDAQADIPLKNGSEIAGVWKLVSVAAALDKPRTEENRTWEFRADGTIITSGYNRHFKTEDRHEWKYKIVNGKISADDPGRPGKTIDYAVYEMKGNEMILKGGIEGFYFFKKQ